MVNDGLILGHIRVYERGTPLPEGMTVGHRIDGCKDVFLNAAETSMVGGPFILGSDTLLCVSQSKVTLAGAVTSLEMNVPMFK
jgi:hypothetical protein